MVLQLQYSAAPPENARRPALCSTMANAPSLSSLASTLSQYRSRRSWVTATAIGLLASGFDLSSIANVASAADAPSARWAYEVTIGSFEIHADFEITPQSDLLDELDKLSGDVTQLLELPSPSAAIHIVIFGSSEEYRRYMTHYYPALPPRRALFIQQRGTGMLFAHKHPDLATDLRHETTHAILNQGTKPLPLWMDEGLAEYFEVPAAQRWSGQPHLLSIRSQACTPKNDLGQLEALDDVSKMTADHYRDAWAWVHFLLHRRSSTRKLLLEQLQVIRSNRGALPFSRIVTLAVPDWQSEIADHFQRLI